MLEGDLKEIVGLLENILVFEIKFKEEVLAKAKTMNDHKLNKLKSILSEVDEWQKKILGQKIKEDPDFYNKMVSIRKESDQEIINLYKKKLNDEDNKKIEIILDKMKSL